MRSRGSSITLATGARKSLVLLGTAVLLCSLMLQYTALAAPQRALALNPSLFELDGNVTKETYTDWNTINNGGGSPFASIFIDDPINGNGDKYFDGGNTKDTINIPSWAWTTVSQPQDKNDIQNAYAAAYHDNGHLVVFFGLDRYAANGDAQVGFWFLQNEFGLTGGPATGGFSGTHKEGDVLVQIDFQNGGADPVLRVYNWSGGALVLKDTGGSCATADSGATRCGIASTGDTDPNWAFDDKFAGGTDNDIPAGGMVEGGIDLTALGLDNSCFASFVAETRSSQSPTSTLSDFANGSFALCSKPDISTHVKQDGQNVSTINKGESVTDHAVLTGDSGTVKGSVKFYVCRDANAAPDCSSGGDQVGGSVALSGGEADSDAFTPTQLGYYCFRVAYVPAEGSKYLADSHTNKTSECFRVIPADVKIHKTAGQASVSAGSDISFTLSWGNVGEGKATGVVISDDLPGKAGLDWSIQSSTGTGSTCSISGAVGSEVLTCNVGAIAGNTTTSGTVTLVSGTTAASCGVVDNTGSITSTNDGSGSSSASTTVNCPDVKVTKTPNNGSINAGETATFSIKVENIGAGTATGVSVSDNLPGAVHWTEDEADCSIAGADGAQVLTCNVGTLAPGAAKTYSVSAETSGPACGILDNTATASATNEPSSVLANNSDDGSITVLCASIDIEKVADDASVSAGDAIGFTITVTSKGPGEAKGVVMTDVLPTDAGTSWTIDGGTGAADCAIVTGTISCDFGDMAKDAAFTVHISSPTTTATVADSPVVNTASVTTTNDGSDTDTDQVVVLGASIDIEKVADDASVSAGDAIGFTITVTSKGPGEAKGVVMTDVLPTDAGTSWTIDGGTGAADCAIVTGTISCDFGDMAKDAAFTVHISSPTTTATVADSPVVNTASVTTTNDGSDTDTDQVVVLPPDIKVTKDAVASPISAGDSASYTIKVENIGQGTAYLVTLADTLPAGITWTENSDACSIADGKLACDFGTMLPGASRTVTVSGETTAADCGALPNLAIADASNEPSNLLANNSDGATITVDCPAIVITKSAVDPQVNATDTIAFDIVVTNTGVGNAYGVTVSDNLPTNDGLGWSIDAANSDAGWTIQNGTLKFGPATLASGASVKVRLTSDTTPASCGTIDNTATVTYQGGDGSDDSSIVVLCPDVTISKTADNSPILAGQTASYTISAWNEGPGTAYDVVITDTVPAGIEWTVDNEDCAIEDGVLTCQVGTLAKSDDPFTVTLSGPTDAEDCGDLPNSASVSATNEPDGKTGNNEDDATITVQCASITLVKTAGEAADGAELLLQKPGNVVFTYVVTNTGTADLVDVALVDDNATAGDTSDDITITCPSITLAAGASMTCTATLPVTYGLRTNIATVTANPDLDPTAEVSATDDAVVRVPEPEVTPTPRPTPKLTPPPTSTLDSEAPGSSGNGLLLVLLSIAGLMLAVGYLIPAPARARRRDRRS